MNVAINTKDFSIYKPFLSGARKKVSMGMLMRAINKYRNLGASDSVILKTRTRFQILLTNVTT